MLPRVERQVDAALPHIPGTVWNFSDETGYFCGSEELGAITTNDAVDVLEAEATLMALVDEVSGADGDLFEEVAASIESGFRDDLDNLLRPEQLAKVDRVWEPFDFPLMSLELGVAGLVYALNTFDVETVASCRGHTSFPRWSDHPVVYIALGEHHAYELQELVAAHACGFMVDPGRPNLLVVEAACIGDSHALAESVLGVATKHP